MLNPIRPTIKSIAKALNLSHATVSMALRDHPLIKSDTKERVKSAAAKAGYIPNGIAQAMRQRKTKTLGIIVSNMALSFTGMIVDAIEQKAREHGYQCLLCQVHGDPLKLESVIQVLTEQRAAGLVIQAINFQNDQKIYRKAIPPNVACVFCDGEIPSYSASAVLSDSFEIGYLGTRHLLDLGHRRIACLRGPERSQNSLDRLSGYRAALKSAKVDFDPTLVIPAGWAFADGLAAGQELLRRKVRFTGVVAPADAPAVGAMKAFIQGGLHIPKDISIVGAGNCDFAELVTPMLTSVEQYPAEIGRNALELLIKKIEDRDSEPVRKTIPPTLVRRESTEKPKKNITNH